MEEYLTSKEVARYLKIGRARVPRYFKEHDKVTRFGKNTGGLTKLYLKNRVEKFYLSTLKVCECGTEYSTLGRYEDFCSKECSDKYLREYRLQKKREREVARHQKKKAALFEKLKTKKSKSSKSSTRDRTSDLLRNRERSAYEKKLYRASPENDPYNIQEITKPTYRGRKCPICKKVDVATGQYICISCKKKQGHPDVGLVDGDYLYICH